MAPALGALALATLVALVLSTLQRRRDRTTSSTLAAEQRQVLGQLVEEVSSLREALVSSGAVERAAKPPPAPADHTGPTVEVRTPDEPPSTKPTPSRKVPASPRSAPRPVSLEDQISRAMKRIERLALVPPEVEARWEERLRALGAELGLVADTEPTDAQLDAMIRELYEAEADVKDARPCALPPPMEATLSSAVSPISDPLAGGEPERPKSSATRTAEAFRNRPTLLGGIVRSDPPDDGNPS